MASPTRPSSRRTAGLETTRDAARPPPAWLLVAAMAVAVAVGPGALVPFAFGAFIKALAADYGWGRGEVSAGIGLFTFTLAFGMPWFGGLVDRFGPRGPAIASVALFAAAMAVMSFVGSEFAFMAVFAAMGLVAGGASGLPYSKAISARFHRRRGLAFGLGAAGLGLGGVVLPHVTQHLLGAYGWRGGFLGLAVLTLLLSVPSAAFGLRGVPKDRAPEEPAAPFRPWRQASSWIIGVTLALIATAVGGMMVHGVALLTDRGLSPATAAALMSTVALSSIAGRVAGGYLMDLFFAPRVTAAIFLIAAAGALMLAFGGSPAWWWPAMVCVGFVAGADVDVLTYIVSRYCSAEHFGKLFGLMMFVFTTCSGLGVYLMGASHDLFGSYDIALAGSAALATTAAILVLRLGPYTNKIEG